MRKLMGRLKPAPTMALIAAVGVAAALVLTASPAVAQARAYRAPRTPDGKPNLQGVYQAITEAYWDIEPHSAAPGIVQELGASNATPAGLGITDGAGNFRSDQLHVVERSTATDADHLAYEATIEDPQTFTRPWKISLPIYRRLEKNAQLLEFNCVPFVEDLIYGALRKPSSN